MKIDRRRQKNNKETREYFDSKGYFQTNVSAIVKTAAASFEFDLKHKISVRYICCSVELQI